MRGLVAVVVFVVGCAELEPGPVADAEPGAQLDAAPELVACEVACLHAAVEYCRVEAADDCPSYQHHPDPGGRCRNQWYYDCQVGCGVDPLAGELVECLDELVDRACGEPWPGECAGVGGAL